MPQSEHAIHAPFNFVPIPEKVLAPYSTDHMRQRYNGPMADFLSGRIRITITADTPIIVNQPQTQPQGEEVVTPFPRTPEGKHFIPGSTLRGLLRSNMTILGFGPAVNGNAFTNVVPYLRQIWDPSKEPSTFSREIYRTTLGIETHQIPNTDKRYSIPTKVSGGYLYCHSSAKAYIRPTKGPVCHISREDPLAAPWKNRYACHIKVWYQICNNRVSALAPEPFIGGKPGQLLCPGWKKNQKSIYLFPEPDLDATPIPMSDEQIIQYQVDYAKRKHLLRGTHKDHPADPEFWALPTQPDAPKPVFYHMDGGRLSIGTSRFLRLQCIHKPSDLLTQAHSLPANRNNYPTAIFGTVHKNISSGSLVSIGDCTAEGNPVPILTKIPLRRPNPAYSPIYLLDDKTYNHPDPTLRGYKHYWLKDPVAVVSRTHLSHEALPKGTRFSGVIRYHHLTPDELGLLLWCITLEDGCFHHIGRGKPYGYGRIRIQIDELYEFDPSSLYRSLDAAPSPCAQATQRIQDYIRCYWEKAQTLLEDPQKSLRSYPHIQDFLYMKRTIRTDTDQVSYMKITSGYNEFEHANRPLPTVQQIREEAAAP